MPVAAATVQQDFDAAQAKLAAQDFSGAREAFAALLARFPPDSKGRAANLVRARLGAAMIGSGDEAAAVPLLRTSIAGFDKPTADDRTEKGMASFDLARALESMGYIDSAAREYRAIRDEGLFDANSPFDIAVRTGLARTLIWWDPAEARQLLDNLLALETNQLGSSDARAAIQSLRGRVELNNGNPGAAAGWFQKAGASAGGMYTAKANSTDVRVRGDMTIASYLRGDDNGTQRFAAASGAGNLMAQGFGGHGEWPLPACAPVNDLAPDAMAVVEFGLADSGQVFGVTPIYATGGSMPHTGPRNDDGPESLFARWVRGWSWQADRAAAIPAAWRQVVRVEIRCVPSGARQAQTWNRFADEQRAWLAARNVRPYSPDGLSSADALPRIRAEIARREAEDGKDSIQLLAPLDQLRFNGATPLSEAIAAGRRTEALLRRYNAPQSAIVGVQRWLVGMTTDGEGYADLNAVRAGTAALLTDLEKQGGMTPLSLYLRVGLAEQDVALNNPASARSLIDSVLAAPESILPADDPIRVAALLRRSNMAAAENDAATAASALAATGIAPEQCALIDVRPAPINREIGEKAFPTLARMYSSEGLVKVAYDITAAGATTNIRTVLALPPFIYSKATEKALASFRFEPVFRPGNTIGCGGAVQSVRFSIR